MNDDPFAFAFKTVLNTRVNTRPYVTVLLHEDSDDIQVGWDELKSDVLNSISISIESNSGSTPNLTLMKLSSRYNLAYAY